MNLIIKRIRTSMWLPISLLTLLLAAHAPAFSKSATHVRSAVVTRVVDGDTIWVKTAQRSKPLKVRIIGIDAPEACQPGGAISSEALRRLLTAQAVTLSTTGARPRDSYGRLLAKVDLRGEDVGHWMVANGYAWSYSYRRNLGPYAMEQAQAVAARRGLFSNHAAENPRLFRKRHGSCY